LFPADWAGDVAAQGCFASVPERRNALSLIAPYGTSAMGLLRRIREQGGMSA